MHVGLYLPRYHVGNHAHAVNMPASAITMPSSTITMLAVTITTPAIIITMPSRQRPLLPGHLEAASQDGITHYLGDFALI